MTRVKICCIQDETEMALAVAAGASALGLVSAMPSGPGPIADAAIARIARAAPSGVMTVLLTRECDPAALITQARAAGVGAVQLVDAVPDAAYAALRTGLPGLRVIQVIHVEDDGALAEARAVAPKVDALLLDSGRPKAAVPELGGTGRTHDWGLSRRIVERAGVPVFLAGGINPANAAAAIAAVRPYAVDVCTGVRNAGALDPARLSALMAAVRG